MLEATPRKVVLALALALAVAGCGDDASSVEETEVTLGAFHPFSGPLSTVSLNVEVNFNLATIVINRQADTGRGPRIRLAKRDTATDLARTEKQIDGLIEDGVNLFMGAVSSSTTALLLERTNASEKMLVTGISNADFLTDQDNAGHFFRATVRSSVSGQVVSDAITADDHAKVAIITSTLAFDIDLMDTFTAHFEQNKCKRADCTITSRQEFEFDVTPEELDIERKIDVALADDPDILFFAGPPVLGFAYLNAMNDRDYEGELWINPATGFEPNLVELVPAGVPDRIRTVGFVPYLGKHYVAWQELLEENEIEVLEGLEFPAAFDILMAYALAIHKAGSDEADAVAQAFREVTGAPGVVVGPGDYSRAIELLDSGEDIDFHGASAPLDFDARGDTDVEMGIFGISGGFPTLIP